MTQEMEVEIKRLRHLQGVSQQQEIAAFVAKYGSNDIGSTIIRVACNQDLLSTFLSAISSSENSNLLVARSEHLMEVIQVLIAANNPTLLIKFLELIHKSLLYDPEIINGVILQDLLNFAADNIASPDLGLSDISSLVVIDLMSARSSTLKDMLSCLFEKMKGNRGDDLCILRYASTCSKITAKSDLHFEVCCEIGIVDNILSICQSSDILMQVCALDLLLEVSATTAGCRYMFAQGVFEWLLNLSSAHGAVGSTAVPDPILSAQALNTLCTIFSQAMANVDAHHASIDALTSATNSELMMRILHAITGKFDSSDDGGRLTGLNAISNFACISEETMGMVVNDPEVSEKWLRLMTTAKIEIKAACLHSIARVVDSGNDASCSSSIPLSQSRNALKVRLLEALGRIKNQPVVTFLVQLSKQPMHELRNAAMDVMRSIARTGGWGIELLYTSLSSQTSGFRAFIENRFTEHSTDGRDLKFSIIRAIHSNASFPLLPEDVRISIEAMVSQGPYFMPPQTIVDTMEV